MNLCARATIGYRPFSGNKPDNQATGEGRSGSSFPLFVWTQRALAPKFLALGWIIASRKFHPPGIVGVGGRFKKNAPIFDEIVGE
jgi:hypothetical protein